MLRSKQKFSDRKCDWNTSRRTLSKLSLNSQSCCPGKHREKRGTRADKPAGARWVLVTWSCLPLSGQDSVLEPLCFPEQPATSTSAPSLQGPSAELLVCLFCPESVPLQQKDVLLRHLLLEHKLVVADVKLIADLPKYEACARSRSQPVLEMKHVHSRLSVTVRVRSYPVSCQQWAVLLCWCSCDAFPVVHQVHAVLEGQILGAASHRFLQRDQDKLHRSGRWVHW